MLGIPFDFTAQPVVARQPKPRETVAVRAITPDRDACEIRFPRVQGYRVELPEEHVDAKFDRDSTLVLTPDIVGPSVTHNAGIIGEGVDLNLIHRRDLRPATLVYHLTKTLLNGYLPGINRPGAYGRWACPEFTDVYTLQDDSAAAVQARAQTRVGDRDGHPTDYRSDTT